MSRLSAASVHLVGGPQRVGFTEHAGSLRIWAPQQCASELQLSFSKRVQHLRSALYRKAPGAPRSSAIGDVPSSSSSPRQSSASNLKGLVLGRGTEGSWDNGGVCRPVVRRYPSADNDTWHMWYEGWASQGNEGEVEESCPSCAGLALSANGLVWTRGASAVETNSRGEGDAGMVLQPSTNWWSFDTRHVRPADVIMMASPKVRASAGVLWMFYDGQSSEETQVPDSVFEALKWQLSRYANGRPQGKLLCSRPGLALSNDGRNWATIEGEHHSGALFDVGDEQAWDSLLIGSPHVVYHAPGDLRMYYHALDPATWRFSIGLARSRDGLKWVKLGKILETGGSSLGYLNPQVLLNPGFASFSKTSYVLLFDELQAGGKSSIHIAVSEDGLTDWSIKSCILEPNEEGRESAWDSEAVGSPCLVALEGGEGRGGTDDGQGGELRLYYAGFSNQFGTGIGAAENCAGGLTFSRVEVPTHIL